MRLIDADKLFEQVENLYKSAQTPERQVYSNMLDIVAEFQNIKICLAILQLKNHYKISILII